MSHARYSSDIWWARILDIFDELVHNYPKLPKDPVKESRWVYGCITLLLEHHLILILYGMQFAFENWLENNDKKL